MYNHAIGQRKMVHVDREHKTLILSALHSELGRYTKNKNKASHEIHKVN